MLKQKPHLYLQLLISLGLYVVMGYAIQRHETLPLFACYYLLFILYIWALSQKAPDHFWLMGAIFFRAVLLFSVPALSDDFYRYIWDGRLLAAGHHPFAEVPVYYMTHELNIPGIDQQLYSQLNSKIYFTVYPAVSQFIFWLSVKLAPDSVYGSMVVMKLIIFSFEIGTIWLLRKLLSHFNVTGSRVLLYALNPLIILELTGNLHFEGVMIFFLLLAIYLLLKNRWITSAAFYALSVSTKLIPLIFLPLLYRHLGREKALPYWFVTGLFTILLFLPLLNAEVLNGFSQGMGYYFRKFEFNASIYYLIREAGYFVVGYNIIHIAGAVMAVISTTLILFYSFRKLNGAEVTGMNSGFFSGMMWVLLIFCLFTPTLHPWYIIPLIMMCMFTPYRFPIVWSGLIFLTYSGYSPETFNEKLEIVTLEYVILAGYLFYETTWTKRTNRS